MPAVRAPDLIGMAVSRATIDAHRRCMSMRNDTTAAVVIIDKLYHVI
jgi:hypothetical protein